MDVKETIDIIGNTGKRSKITYEDLLKKKITGEIEVDKSSYYIRITRWYRLDKEYQSIRDATKDLIEFIKVIDELKPRRLKRSSRK